MCDTHKNKKLLCVLPGRKQMATCSACTDKVKDEASKWHFWLPTLIFLIINIIIGGPDVIT